MPRKRHSPEQIVAIIRDSERGDGATEVCKKHGISEQTFYRWKKIYGGLGVPEVQRIKQLERENRDLKQLAGDQALAIQVLKERAEKKGWI